MDNKEIVMTKYHLNKGNYIPNVYFEFEKGGAIVFRRKEDGKITYIPKSLIKGGFHRDKNTSQDIRLMDYCTVTFYWLPR